MKLTVVLLMSLLLLLTFSSRGSSFTFDALSLFLEIASFGWGLNEKAKEEEQMRRLIEKLDKVSLAVEQLKINTANAHLEEHIEHAYKEKLLVWMDNANKSSKSYHENQFVIYYENSYADAATKLFENVFSGSTTFKLGIFESACTKVECENVYESVSTLLSKGMIVEIAYACIKSGKRSYCESVAANWKIRTKNYEAEENNACKHRPPSCKKTINSDNKSTPDWVWYVTGVIASVIIIAVVGTIAYCMKRKRNAVSDTETESNEISAKRDDDALNKVIDALNSSMSTLSSTSSSESTSTDVCASASTSIAPMNNGMTIVFKSKNERNESSTKFSLYD